MHGAVRQQAHARAGLGGLHVRHGSLVQKLNARVLGGLAVRRAPYRLIRHQEPERGGPGIASIEMQAMGERPVITSAFSSCDMSSAAMRSHTPIRCSVCTERWVRAISRPSNSGSAIERSDCRSITQTRWP